MHSNIQLGQRAVHHVIDELLERDFIPSIPVVDIGYDLVVDGRVRVQVKASRLVVKPRWKTPVYWFNLTWTRTKGRRRRDGTREYASGPRDFAKECDFVILWGSDQNRFWIVPASIVDRRSTVVVGPDSTKLSKKNPDYGRLGHEVRACENRWDLIEAFQKTVYPAHVEGSSEPQVVAERESSLEK